MALSGGRPAPTHVIAHLSDTHLLGSPQGRLAGRIDTAEQLRRALARLESSREVVDALVISGDLADSGEPAAYELLLEIVRPVVDRLGCALVLTGGNHDERGPMAQVLFGVDGDDPQDRVTTVRGLRIITLDSAVPGYHHGGLSDEPICLAGKGTRDSTPSTAASSSSITHRSRIAPRSCSCSTSRTSIGSARLWSARTCGPCSAAICT